jgi:lysozyme
VKTSQVGRDLIMDFEGCRLEAYPDPKTGGAPWTCGWGATGPSIGPGTVWTQEQADERFDEHLTYFEGLLNNAITTTITQGQWDALISILYNVGPGGSKKDGIIKIKSGAPSTLLRMVNARDFEGAAAQFERWVSPGSNVERGLLRRRQAERRVFESVPPAPVVVAPVAPVAPVVNPFAAFLRWLAGILARRKL